MMTIIHSEYIPTIGSPRLEFAVHAHDIGKTCIGLSASMLNIEGFSSSHNNYIDAQTARKLAAALIACADVVDAAP